MKRIGRRSFVKRSLGRTTGVLAGAAALSSGPLAYSGALGAGERVRIAVVGVLAMVILYTVPR